MEYIAHRINRIEELEEVSPEYGVELDLRDDLTGRIYIQHHPFADGQDFEKYLKKYHQKTMVLNIKSERIEHRALELLRKYQVKKYFFLDSSFPMIKLLSDTGERNIAVRYSEYEGMDTLEAMAGRLKWIWADTFTRFPLNRDIFVHMKELGYKICLVSPELQGQPERIEEYAKLIQMDHILLDAICTKLYYIERWKSLLQ